MYQVLFLLASIGFTGSLIVHVLTITGMLLHQEYYIWLLHIGIFVVFFPLVLELKKLKTRKNPFAILIRICPIPVIIISFILFFYVVFNFLVFMINTEGGVPAEWNGEYVLHNHGELIRKLTENEYRQLQLNELRGFSGHWLIFYFLPMVFFFYKIKNRAKTIYR